MRDEQRVNQQLLSIFTPLQGVWSILKPQLSPPVEKLPSVKLVPHTEKAESLETPALMYVLIQWLAAGQTAACHVCDCNFLFVCFLELGIQLRTSHLLGRHHVTELHPWPFLCFLRQGLTYVVQTGLELCSLGWSWTRSNPASASQALRLQLCTTAHSKY